MPRVAVYKLSRDKYHPSLSHLLVCSGYSYVPEYQTYRQLARTDTEEIFFYNINYDRFYSTNRRSYTNVCATTRLRAYLRFWDVHPLVLRKYGRRCRRRS